MPECRDACHSSLVSCLACAIDKLVTIWKWKNEWRLIFGFWRKVDRHTLAPRQKSYVYSQQQLNFSPGIQMLMTLGSTHIVCLSAWTWFDTGITCSGCWMKVLRIWGPIKCVFSEGNREQQGAKIKCFYSGFPEGLQKGHIHLEEVHASGDNSSCYH